MIIGILFLLKNLGWITGGLWSILWPILLIIVGIKLMMKKKHGPWMEHCCGFGEKMHDKFHEKEEKSV